jgi:hypothetical protein
MRFMSSMVLFWKRIPNNTFDLTINRGDYNEHIKLSSNYMLVRLESKSRDFGI